MKTDLPAIRLNLALRLTQPVFGVLWGMSLAANVGCGTDRPNVYPVTGRVVAADGSPVAGGWVTLRPDDGELKISSRGQIQADGTFALTTFEEGDGALAGPHRAIVTSPLAGDRESPDRPARRLDPRYASYETSGLTVVVTENPSENHFEINVSHTN